MLWFEWLVLPTAGSCTWLGGDSGKWLGGARWQVVRRRRALAMDVLLARVCLRCALLPAALLVCRPASAAGCPCVAAALLVWVRGSQCGSGAVEIRAWLPVACCGARVLPNLACLGDGLRWEVILRENVLGGDRN